MRYVYGSTLERLLTDLFKLIDRLPEPVSDDEILKQLAQIDDTSKELDADLAEELEVAGKKSKIFENFSLTHCRSNVTCYQRNLENNNKLEVY